jgi:hypothetical protein
MTPEALLAQYNSGDRHFDTSDLSNAKLNNQKLPGINLCNAQMGNIDLAGADLAGADLAGAEMRQAQLDGANLRNANLVGANLRWADLSGADLAGADLTGANFNGAILAAANLQGAILNRASFVHADLNRAQLSEVDWAGADFTAAQMHGVKLHNTRPFGATFEAIDCEWIDLSAPGDGSHTFKFNSKNPYEYFYQGTPTVEILIDERLNTEAHSALAVIYQRLARQLNSRLPAPQIQPDRKRTQLTFTLHRDEKLFMTAYTMMFPFTDAAISHQALVEQLKGVTQECLQQPKPQMQAFQRMVTTLNQQRQKIISDPQLQSLAQSVQGVPFFQAPTRMRLGNSAAQALTIYSNPTFGRRSRQLLNRANRSENTLLQTSSEGLQLPPTTAMLQFIQRFRWSEHYLRGEAAVR